MQHHLRGDFCST